MPNLDLGTGFPSVFSFLMCSSVYIGFLSEVFIIAPQLFLVVPQVFLSFLLVCLSTGYSLGTSALGCLFFACVCALFLLLNLLLSLKKNIVEPGGPRRAFFLVLA